MKVEFLLASCISAAALPVEPWPLSRRTDRRFRAVSRAVCDAWVGLRPKTREKRPELEDPPAEGVAGPVRQ